MCNVKVILTWRQIIFLMKSSALLLIFGVQAQRYEKLFEDYKRVVMANEKAALIEFVSSVFSLWLESWIWCIQTCILPLILKKKNVKIVMFNDDEVACHILSLWANSKSNGQMFLLTILLCLVEDWNCLHLVSCNFLFNNL